MDSPADNSQIDPNANPADNSQVQAPPTAPAQAPAQAEDGSPAIQSPPPQRADAETGRDEGTKSIEEQRLGMSYEQVLATLSDQRAAEPPPEYDQDGNEIPRTPAPAPTRNQEPGTREPAPAPAPAVTPPGTPPAPGEDDQPGRIPQIKMRPVDELDATVLRFAKSTGKSVLDPEVIAAARQFHGLPAVAAAPAAEPGTRNQEPPPPDPSRPETFTTIDAAEAAIADLRAQKVTLTSDFRFEEAEALQAQIDGLIKRQVKLETVAEQAQAQGNTEFDRAWQATVAQTQAFYPDAAKPDSALSKRAAEIQAAERMANNGQGSDLYHRADSALTYYSLAAAELGIARQAAADPGAPPPKSVPSSQPVTRPGAATLLGGGNAPGSASRPATDQVPNLQTKDDVTQLVTALKASGNGRSGPVHTVPKFLRSA